MTVHRSRQGIHIHMHIHAASTSFDDCRCVSSFYYNSSTRTCTNCPNNYYSPQGIVYIHTHRDIDVWSIYIHIPHTITINSCTTTRYVCVYRFIISMQGENNSAKLSWKPTPVQTCSLWPWKSSSIYQRWPKVRNYSNQITWIVDQIISGN
jgi:hypothetical protein